MSGLKGFPSNQKLPLGSGITNEFVTVQPTDKHRNALDVAARFAFRVGGNTPRTAALGTGNIDGLTWVYETATPAKVGDFVRFDSGACEFLEVPIVKVETDRFLLGAFLSPAPVATDDFFIMRYATQRVGDDGTQLVSVSPSPVAFVLDGVATEVEEDTGTPANSIPLPVKVMDSSGAPIDFATEATQAAILADTASMDTNIASLEAKDFATETTLASAAADLGLIEAKDFATEATLGALDIKVGVVSKTDAGDSFLLVGGRRTGPNYHAIHVDAQGDVQVDVLSSALPTGAATEATLASILADTAAIETSVLAIEADIALLEAKDFATETTLLSVDAELVTANAALVTANGHLAQLESDVTLMQSDVSALAAATERDVFESVRYDYAAGTVSTSAYTEIVASISEDVKEIEIFDSSGEALWLAVGAASSEVDKLIITPGGNGRIPASIALNTRLSVKAIANAASDGVLIINFYN